MGYGPRLAFLRNRVGLRFILLANWSINLPA